jgi:hypothetical protein
VTASPTIPRNHLVTATSGRSEPRQDVVAVREIGAPGEIRTPDPLVRSQVLYPAELRARGSKLRAAILSQWISRPRTKISLDRTRSYPQVGLSFPCPFPHLQTRPRRPAAVTRRSPPPGWRHEIALHLADGPPNKPRVVRPRAIRTLLVWALSRDTVGALLHGKPRRVVTIPPHFLSNPGMSDGRRHNVQRP